MEAGTASTSTGSATIADLISRAAEMYADAPAVRQKIGDAWHDVTYTEVGEIVSEIGRGLIDLGIREGDRVALLANTRPEWTYVDFGISSAGGVVVPIYPTNSPEECEWVVGNSESRAVVCENAAQVAKIVEVRDRLEHLEQIIVMDPEGAPADAIPLDALRERGRATDAGALAERSRAVTRDDAFTF